jgi:TatD DNase family protein
MDKNIKLTDTHCHLYSDVLKSDMDNVMKRALNQGLSRIFMPNIDSTSIEAMLWVEDNFDFCYSMMGLHPCSVKDDYLKELDLLNSWFDKRAFAGVGETGIDLYWDKSYFEQQKICFDFQIDMSKDLQLPIIIHSRESLDITIDMISQKQKGGLTGIFHCFTGDAIQAQKIIDLGFYLGIGGVLTYKNSTLSDILLNIDLSHIVLETDSPYLPPVPMRGKANEPSYLLYICEKLAALKQNSVENVAEITNANAEKIFNIKQ